MNQSLECCSKLIKELENHTDIPENKFSGKTASALREAHMQQIKKLKEVRDLLQYL